MRQADTAAEAGLLPWLLRRTAGCGTRSLHGRRIHVVAAPRRVVCLNEERIDPG